MTGAAIPGRRTTADHTAPTPATSLAALGVHVGAEELFTALADEGINIMMISTSEIKISCVIDGKYTELAVRALHKAFNLEGKAGAAAGTRAKKGAAKARKKPEKTAKPKTRA